MHPQLEKIIADFGAASERLRRISTSYTHEDWSRAPEPGSWSAAECVAHLNMTAEAFVPLLTEAYARARALGGTTPARLRRDILGWLIWRSTKPGGKIRVKTTPSFIPLRSYDKGQLERDFARLQTTQVELVRAADGLPIHRVKTVSPFAERLSYSVYSALTILSAHQHRHLGQAERALEKTRATSG